MLLLENLDDRTFKDIVENARRTISRLNSEWTDENYHDPGITILELFAWIAEIQQYRLDRITSQSELKFLRILGEKPISAEASRTFISVSEASEGFNIPRGTQLTTDNLTFETMQKLYYHPLTIEKVMVVTGKETVDFTSPNRYSRSGYPAFGREAKKGNRLLIGLSGPIPEDLILNIYLDLFDDYPVPRGKWNEGESTTLPSAKLSWKYFGWDGHGGAWRPLNIVKDETIHCSKDGILEVMVKSRMEPIKINPANDKPRYWLQCEVVEEGYEITPRLNQIALNTVHAIQKETLSHQEVMQWNGSSDTTFILTNFLQYYGINRLQVQDEDGSWFYWNEVKNLQQLEFEKESYYIEKDPMEMTSKLILSSLCEWEGNHSVYKNIRVISYLPEFDEKRLIGNGSGLPNEVFLLPEGLQGVHYLRIQTGSRDNAGKRMAWQDWTQVEDLDASGPDDRHFVLDSDKGVIYFGNDEHGAIPETSDIRNISILSCSTTAGMYGNIKENNRFDFKIGNRYSHSSRATNMQKAHGGKDAESLESAKQRLLRAYFKPDKAVTAADYEALAMETPGVRIACAKAIPCFSPYMQGYPEIKAEGQVSVVVVPYSDKDRPMPSRNFLKNVHKHLENYRLIGTQIYVIPPAYIKISVRAIIMVRTRDFSKPRMISALDEMLNPFDREKGRLGWNFKGTVFKSDVLGLLNRVPGVEYVSELWLQSEGNGGNLMAGGDIELPPYGLPVAGSYEIEVKDVNE
ncbi:MAG: putative baseplate assembly protein [Syntrophomonas sp.]